MSGNIVIRDVGAALRWIRDVRGLTQQQVAGLVNVPQVTVWRWETAHIIPRADSLLHCADALGYDLVLVPREATP